MSLMTHVRTSSRWYCCRPALLLELGRLALEQDESAIAQGCVDLIKDASHLISVCTDCVKCDDDVLDIIIIIKSVESSVVQQVERSILRQGHDS